jgi:hypothetical protein
MDPSSSHFVQPASASLYWLQEDRRFKIKEYLGDRFLGCEAWRKIGFQIQEVPFPETLTIELLKKSDPLVRAGRPKCIGETSLLVFLPSSLQGKGLSLNTFQRLAGRIWHKHRRCETAAALFTGSQRVRDHFATFAPGEGRWHLLRMEMAPFWGLTFMEQMQRLRPEYGLLVASARTVCLAKGLHCLTAFEPECVGCRVVHYGRTSDEFDAVEVHGRMVAIPDGVVLGDHGGSCSVDLDQRPLFARGMNIGMWVEHNLLNRPPLSPG